MRGSSKDPHSAPRLLSSPEVESDLYQGMPLGIPKALCYECAFRRWLRALEFCHTRLVCRPFVRMERSLLSWRQRRVLLPECGVSQKRGNTRPILYFLPGQYTAFANGYRQLLSFLLHQRRLGSHLERQKRLYQYVGSAYKPYLKYATDGLSEIYISIEFQNREGAGRAGPTTS